MDKKIVLEDMLDKVREKHKDVEINGFMINSEDIVFEERVKMICFYCGRYNKNWKCPPNIPQINYKKMFEEFNDVAVVYVKMKVEENYENVRTDSSVILHKALLDCEKILWNNNRSEALSFIGGSCKLCKNGCGVNGCNNPYQSRSPVEALGINVLKTVEKYGMKLEFPIKEYMFRVGMLLW